MEARWGGVMATLNISRNGDTIVVRFGRQIENIGLMDKPLIEAIDAVFWAAITMGAKVNKEVIAKIVEGLKY